MGASVTIRKDIANALLRVEYAGIELRTDDDVRRWRDAVEAEFARHGDGPFDVIILLDGLVVRPGASRAYGEHRAAIIARWVVRSYRVGGDATTRTSVFTSAAITGAHANLAATYEDAVRSLMSERAHGRRPRIQ